MPAPEGVAWFRVSTDRTDDPGLLPFSENEGGVEGFELCSLVVLVRDGVPHGGFASQQINLRDCGQDN